MTGFALGVYIGNRCMTAVTIYWWCAYVFKNMTGLAWNVWIRRCRWIQIVKIRMHKRRITIGVMTIYAIPAKG